LNGSTLFKTVPKGNILNPLLSALAKTHEHNEIKLKLYNKVIRSEKTSEEYAKAVLSASNAILYMHKRNSLRIEARICKRSTNNKNCGTKLPFADDLLIIAESKLLLQRYIHRFESII
jgi:hypothetical protein